MKTERTFTQAEINSSLRTKIEGLYKAYKRAKADGELALYSVDEIYGKMMAILDIAIAFADHDTWWYIQNVIRKALDMECI